MAKVAARAALAAAGPNDEVVIADNSDEPIALGIVDSRLRMVRASRVLSMPENWENALRASRGQWNIMLADKFRIVPRVLRALRQSIPKGTKVATYARPEFWQELSDADALDFGRLESSPGTLTRSDAEPRMVLREAAPAFRRWFNSVKYMPELPMLYTAIVHRDVIAAGYSRSAHFFFGNSPDVASSLQILSSVDAYWETNLPAVLVHLPSNSLTWSNGASNLVGGDLAKQFVKEFGTSPFERHRLPAGLTSGVFETLLTYRELHGNDSPKPSWRMLASQATREIEAPRKTDRSRQHIRLLRATQSPHPRPSAALEQMGMIGILRTYRALTKVAPFLPQLVWRAKKLDLLARRSREPNLQAAIERLEVESSRATN